MVSMDDKSERDKKRQRPIGHTFLGHVSKASSEYSVTSGLFDLMSTNSNDRNGDRKMMRTMRKSRSPKRYNSNSKGSSSKHWQVKVPRRMVCTVAAIFLLLPMAIFTWKETHWHAEEHHAEEHAVKHIRKRNKRNAYPTWMEDAEKEASALLLNEQVNDGVVGVLDNNNAQKNSTVDTTGNILQSGADSKEGQLLSENQPKAAAVSKAESTNQTDSESDSKDEGEDTVDVPSDQTDKDDGSGQSNQQQSAEDTDGEDSAGENHDKNEAPESPSEDESISGNAAAGDDAEEGSSAAQEAKAVGSSQQEDAIEDKVEDSEQVSNQESVEQQ